LTRRRDGPAHSEKDHVMRPYQHHTNTGLICHIIMFLIGIASLTVSSIACAKFLRTAGFETEPAVSCLIVGAVPFTALLLFFFLNHLSDIWAKAHLRWADLAHRMKQQG